MTELVIWNRALALISAPTIRNLTDTSPQRTLVDIHYPSLTRDFAGDHPWDGCTTVIELVVDAAVVKPDRYATAYTLPADFEAAWKLNDQELGRGAQPLYEIMALPALAPTAKFLLTDVTAAKLEYSWDPNTDVLVDLLSGKAQTALVHMLAIDLARPMGKKESDIKSLERTAQEKMYEARLANGRQQKRKHSRERPLVDARILRF